MNEQATPGKRRPRVLPRITDTALVDGLSPELLVALALRRTLGGGVAKTGDIYVDSGHPMGRHLTATFTKLIDCGLLTLTDDDTWGLRRVTVTEAGRVRYAEVCGILRRDHR